jgi:hypothetical protein
MLDAHKIQRLTFKSPLIAPNSHKNPMQHRQPDVYSPGKKGFSQLFLFLFFSQQAEDRASIRIKLCDILDPYPMESLPKIDNPDMNPYSYTHLVFEKGTKNIQWRKDSLFNK